MSSTNTPQQPTQGAPNDLQALGHLVASFAGALVILLVHFGVPLTPEQQNGILTFVFATWALGSGVYAYVTKARSPMVPPPPRVSAVAPAPEVTDQTAVIPLPQQYGEQPPGGTR